MKKVQGILFVVVAVVLLLGGCIIFSPPGIMDKWAGGVTVTADHPYPNGFYNVQVTFTFDPLFNPNHINGGTMRWVFASPERQEQQLEERMELSFNFNITSGDFTGSNLVFFATDKNEPSKKIKFEGSVTGSKGSHSCSGTVYNQSGGAEVGTFTIGEQ